MRHMLAASLAILGACGATDADDPHHGGLLTDAGLYEVVATPLPDPPVSGPAALGLEVVDAAAEAHVVGAAVVVTPWMPAMGHGVMGEVVVTELGEGAYEASWEYPMPGAWEVTVEVDGDAGIDSLVLDFEVE